MTPIEELLNLGWALLPCCCPSEEEGCLHHGAGCPSPGKRPLVSWKPYQRKPPSVRQVKGWARKWPDANWAVLTGAASGLVVLDLDAPPEELELGPMQLTATSATGRGQHRFFQAGKQPLRSQTVSAAVEFKAEGAYIVLPESLHPSGERYRWVISPWELEGELAPIPEWLERKLRENPRHPSRSPRRSLEEIVHGVEEGERNTQATRIAGKLLGAFPPKDWEAVAWPLLAAWNQRNKPPLPEEELLTIFEKIAERESVKQRQADDKRQAEAAALVQAALTRFSIRELAKASGLSKSKIERLKRVGPSAHALQASSPANSSKAKLQQRYNGTPKHPSTG